ncbi:hypothetical protein WJX81_002035 [Elliptochloris bilobata]|uniref:Sugar phosphate transporter domain-containing protein n=1 Tax=Elliptochloris bilobata TaxID=381761 RepID=A0AAW1QJZ0_9CHLO
MNMLNKWALGIYGFSFPLFLTSAHMVFSFIMLLPFMMASPFRELHHDVITKQWKGLACIGLFMAVNIAFNNLSLVSLSLSLNQVIRSSIPVMTALLAVVVESKVPTRFEAAALVVLCAGVMLTVWEGLAGSAVGILLCLAGTVSNAAMMTMSGRVLSERVDALRLTFYTAPVSCLVLLPFYHWREAERLSEYASRHPDSAFLGVLAASCACALTYNVVHYLMIQRTSAVTTTVLGEIKIVAILMLSALVFGEGRLMTLRMALGCAVALLGRAPPGSGHVL